MAYTKIFNKDEAQKRFTLLVLLLAIATIGSILAANTFAGSNKRNIWPERFDYRYNTRLVDASRTDHKVAILTDTRTTGFSIAGHQANTKSWRNTRDFLNDHRGERMRICVRARNSSSSNPSQLTLDITNAVKSSRGYKNKTFNLTNSYANHCFNFTVRTRQITSPYIRAMTTTTRENGVHINKIFMKPVN